MEWNGIPILGIPIQVASSAKWGLGDNVVLRMMQCLTPSVSFDLLTISHLFVFCLLTHLVFRRDVVNAIFLEY